MDSSNSDSSLKLLPPPANLPRYSVDDLRDVSYFAQTTYSSAYHRSQEIFGLKRADRRRHVYIIGKSGMGKTRTLEQLIRFDIFYGYSLAVIDPHGDLALALLDFMPEDRIEDVIYVDPADVDHPIAFNPFADVPTDLRQTVAQGLIEIFRKQFAATWTPRMEHLFRFATLATLEDPEGTLYGFLQLLTDARYRQRVITHVTDDVVRRFFSIEFASFSEKYDNEAITPLTNRLGQFFADPLMRAIFSQKENKIDFDEIMNRGKILLLNISKGSLGEENSALFGSIFLTKINQTAMARGRIPEKDRKEFYLYVDEFQNVATQTFTSLFSESRKYAINITVANQYLSQIPFDLQETIFGNVGTLISFRVGGSDAERLSQEFAPMLGVHDLINLGAREIYIKMPIDGHTEDPFSAEIVTVEPPKHESYRQRIIERSRAKYSRTMAEIKDAAAKAEAVAQIAPPADIESLPPPV